MSPCNSSTIKIYTGLTPTQFDTILNLTHTSLLSKFKYETKLQCALYIYFMKLKTDHTYSQMAPHFGVSPRTISSWVRIVREIVYNDFVPLYLFNQNRNDILLNTTPLSRKLYNVNNDTAILVLDGTYVYVIKSSNFDFQKNTYSMQKHRNLIKFMMCITTNGLIVGAYGPYEAKKNDATILKEIMAQPGNVFQYLREGDVIVVDRGFRDCVQDLKSRKFVVQIPKLVKHSNAQLSKKEANESRLVTKTRYVVEARNSHIKNQWKHLDGVKIYQSIPYLKKDFQIGSALVNAFSSKIQSDKNDWEKIVDRMLAQFNKPNSLSRIVDRIPQKSFTPVMDLTLFPKCSYDDLKNISQGTYQIKNAPSYCQYHLKSNDGHFLAYVCDAGNCRKYCSDILEINSNPLLMLAKLPSRFQKRKLHKTYVLFNLAPCSSDKQIVSYCCTCKNGLRTIGCCSHVMSIIWYTIFIEKSNLPLPSSNFDNIFDAENIVDSDSESNSEFSSNSSITNSDSESKTEETEQSSE